jgi:hypothetical protein
MSHKKGITARSNNPPSIKTYPAYQNTYRNVNSNFTKKSNKNIRILPIRLPTDSIVNRLSKGLARIRK